jgi:hypothetical protein
MRSDPEIIRQRLLSFLQLRRVACFAERHARAEYREPERAIGYTQISTGTRDHARFLCVDVDDSPSGAMCWADAGVPPPHFVVQSRDNPGSVHLIYALQFPAARRDPQCEAALMSLSASVDGGDDYYTNSRVRSPCSPDWISYCVDAAPALGYTLRELLEQLDAHRGVRRVPLDGSGRNVTLFRELSAYAGSEARRCTHERQLVSAVSAEARRINGGFAAPLPRGEVAGVVRSVAAGSWRYHIRTAAPRWRHRQRCRSRRGVAVRQARALDRYVVVAGLRAQGMTWRQVAAATGWTAEACRALHRRGGGHDPSSRIRPVPEPLTETREPMPGNASSAAGETEWTGTKSPNAASVRQERGADSSWSCSAWHGHRLRDGAGCFRALTFPRMSRPSSSR